MLSRIEVGSKEHVLLWLADKDPDVEYKWDSFEECPCATYAKEHNLPEWNGIDPINLNGLAGEWPRTWGALYERASKALGRISFSAEPEKVAAERRRILVPYKQPAEPVEPA